MKILLILIFSVSIYSQDTFKYAYIQNGCSPDKIPSKIISFFEKKIDCKKISKTYPKVAINWWNKFPEVPVTNSSYIMNDTKAAAFSFCPFESKCETPKQFGIHFDDLDSKKGHGNFIIKRQNDAFLKSNFKLDYCPDLKKTCG